MIRLLILLITVFATFSMGFLVGICIWQDRVAEGMPVLANGAIYECLQRYTPTPVSTPTCGTTCPIRGKHDNYKH